MNEPGELSHLPEIEPEEQVWQPYNDQPLANHQLIDEPVINVREAHQGYAFLALLCPLLALLALATALFGLFDLILKLLFFLIAGALLLVMVVAVERSHPLTPPPVETVAALETSEEYDFEHLVRLALQSIPEEYHQKMENLALIIEDEPDLETLRRMGTSEGQVLLGLYEGTPLPAQSSHGAPLPEKITLYQHTIEAYCLGDPERIRAQVRSTLLHEVAHHFGIPHEEMPLWIR